MSHSGGAESAVKRGNSSGRFPRIRTLAGGEVTLTLARAGDAKKVPPSLEDASRATRSARSNKDT
jgi:hypothetical protein